jgi:leucyl-tRNA synthetase
VFEVDAHDTKEHWLGTFPYPYMNGVLHLGHAFTAGKVDFSVGYWRLKGVNAIFPFGFHCTGMPIKAASDTLKREIEMYGNPPKFPTEEEGASAASDANLSKKAASKASSKYQWEIMEQSGVPPSEITKFTDATYWLKYFPPIAKVRPKTKQI